MLLISLGAATVVLIAFWIFITPKQREHIEKMRAGKKFLSSSFSNQSTVGTVQKKEGCLDKMEKKLGWDAETRRRKRQGKVLSNYKDIFEKITGPKYR